MHASRPHKIGMKQADTETHLGYRTRITTISTAGDSQPQRLLSMRRPSCARTFCTRGSSLVSTDPLFTSLMLPPYGEMDRPSAAGSRAAACAAGACKHTGHGALSLDSNVSSAL